MPSALGSYIHTAVGLGRFDKTEIPGASNELFVRSEPGSPISDSTHEIPEFDIGADQKKFTAGWKCIAFLDRESSLEEDEEFYFNASNPDGARKGVFQEIYKDSVCDSVGVRKEIGCEILKQAQQVSKKMDAYVSKLTIIDNQLFCMDNKTFQGLTYLHPRDEAYQSVLSDSSKDIHVFLPGYATGDRYTLISAALVEPRLKISIGYSEGSQHERASAEEAASVIEKALLANGELNPDERISLLSYSGKSLKSARESLDESATRCHFSHQTGNSSPLTDLASIDTHVFHISVTTEILNQYFSGESGLHKEDKHLDVRQKLHALVSPEEKLIIDGLVDDVVKTQGIQKDSIGLWVADREYANEREAEAISRPSMFELIADAFEQSGKNVYFIADTYINNAKNDDGSEVVVNRQPYRPSARPHIGRFWAAEIDGERLLAPRQNQWYFMDRLLQTVGGSLVGIRSGALEPFALMGHNIIYLEHKGMFTPERHASWQGNIPYNRLVITNTTGYLKGNTELKLKNLIQQNLSRVVIERNKTEVGRALIRSAEETIGSIIDDVHDGQISGKELQLLIAMTETSDTAIDTAKKIWPEEVALCVR
jgi:hypothetical protein